jgi:hypothetical protein
VDVRRALTAFFFLLQDMSSTDQSDAKVQELVQFVNRASVDMVKDIDSALSSTDESDEDSFRRRSVGSEMTAAAVRSKHADPRHEIDTLKDKVRLLLVDRKVQKDEIDAQKAEISSLRSLAKEAGVGVGGNASLDVVVLQGELNEAKREVATLKTRLSDKTNEVLDKEKARVLLESRMDKLMDENASQAKVIEAQNAKIARLAETPASRSVNSTGAQSNNNNTFEADFAALDAALGQIDTTSTKRSPLSPEQSRIAELEAKVKNRDSEIASLMVTVKRLEALAFSAGESSASDAEQDKKNSAAQSQVRFLKETSDEQAQTIKLQKSTIGSLKEEVELLTRQLGEQSNNNSINAEKQKKVAAQQRAEQTKLAEQADKLARDRVEFVKHLKAFKDQRKEFLDGNATLVQGGGISKARYRLLRHKRDKYKRKDYRKGHDVNAMQKRLLQNVELLEVEDSQSSSETGASHAASSQAVSDRDESAKSQASGAKSARSVQLVHDSSSEHADSE